MASRLNTAAQMRRRRFTPFKQPTTAPVGSYDPSLAAQLRASGRGLGDLAQQFNTNPDLTLNIGGQDQHFGLGTNVIRSQEDTASALGRGGEDYQTSLAALLRQRDQNATDYNNATADTNTRYRNLATSQSEAANAAGILGSSGYDQQARTARATNQSHDQGALDEQNRRAVQANQSQQDTLGRNWTRQQEDVARGNLRQGQDWNTQLGQGVREYGAFAGDTNQSELYQSQLAGMLPTAPPSERTRANLTYQQIPGGGAILPNGRVISQKGLLRTLRSRGWRPK